ncbi:MAG: hypothetical protein LBK99_04270 [Opitutaceae bacterium]|jgi:hypothetical protein|nr:hypothetical protein [Opitutaceae bacterium]
MIQNTRNLHKHILSLGLAAGMLCASSAPAAVLLTDDFSDGNYTANPVWTVQTGVWSASDGVIQSAGTRDNEYLVTKFSPITNGTFSISVDVRFDSTDAVGNNRLYLLMRDSSNGSAGYEVAIAQGTLNNTQIRAISGASVGTQTKATSAYTFSTTGFVTVTWTRTALGEMVVSIAGTEYMRVATSSVSIFDTFMIGSRSLVAATETTSEVAYTHAFDNILLTSPDAAIPEAKTAALLVGVAGLIGALLWRRQSSSR